MKFAQPFRWMLGLVIVILFVSACGTTPAAPATSVPALPTNTSLPAATDTSAPTTAPTAVPTAVPPTAAPTVAPTDTATAVPPTVAPTEVPPTAAPTAVPPTNTAVPAPTQAPTAVPPTATPAPSSGGCNLDAGNAGIFVINDFDGDMTFTVLNHEYHIPGHGQLLVQVPGGQKFTASVSVPGVGKTNFGPVTLDGGKCYKYEPTRG